MTESSIQARSSRRVTLAITILAGLVAFALRWYYVVHAQVLQPIDQPNVRADAVDYYRYAWNLVHHATFASDLPGGGSVHPNSFRDPGYPLLLAALMTLTSGFDAWYASVLITQAVLGSLTVSLLILAARDLLPRALLAVAAILMCVWPHSVSMPSFVLSETLTGFLCAAALFACQGMLRQPSVPRIILTGSLLGLAGLTNAVLAPLGIVASLALYAAKQLSRRQASTLLVCAFALPLAWGIRSMSIPSAGGAETRAAMNFVQGSWPNYHDDYQLSAKGDASALAGMHLIDDDVAAFAEGTRTGLDRVASRIASDPFRYLLWYAGKPALLWGWDIRIGQGDIYVYPTAHSPFKESSPWRLMHAICFVLNPILLLFAALGAVFALVRPSNRPGIHLVCSVVFLLVTAVYGLLQSEPRYSVPFRGIEILLAMLAIHQSRVWYQALRGTPDPHHISASSP